MLEVWLASVHVAGSAVSVGRRAEAEGFDGISFGDTQNIAADPFAGLCLAATQTERLGLMVGVINPVTAPARRRRIGHCHRPGRVVGPRSSGSGPR